MSATCVASVGRTATEHASFGRFFDSWIVGQDRYLQQLISVSAPPKDGEEEEVVRPLVNQVLRHYQAYYRAKSRWAKHDVLSILSPSWRTSLEDAFLWIGGWRPTMAFHLLYSKSGLQLESQLAELLRGLSTHDLSDLSRTQLNQIDELQRKTIREEKEITEMMAKQQETVADTSMVELTHIVTEMMREGESNMDDDRVESTLKPKEDGLNKVLEKADHLRLATLESVIHILTPIQAVHFLISAAALHLRIHEWGTKKDEANQVSIH